MAKMTEKELQTLVQSKIKTAVGYQGGELSSDRQDLYDRYLGEKYGNERDGRSQIVTRDVLETVEWIKPSLMRVFFSGDRVVEFDPVGPEDDQAEMETEYCNYVFNKENNGFLIGYEWFHDALAQRTGVLKVWPDQSKKVTKDYYENLNDIELLEIYQSEGVELTKHTATDDGLHNIEVRKVCEKTKIRIECLPPEEFLVDDDANGLDISRCGFCAHETEKTLSDLIAMGFDRKEVESLPTESDEYSHDETINRDYLSDEQGEDVDAPQMRKVDYVEAYVKADMDGDGIAELILVHMAGDKVLDWEEADFIPFVPISSLPLPHKFSGLCVADLVTDLQAIRTTIMRQMLDAMYLSNNPRPTGDPNLVNFEDLMNSTPGSPVRTKQNAQIGEVPNGAGQVLSNAMPTLQMLNEMREGRTGVARHTMGLDPNVISKSTDGAYQRALDEANSRIEMISRIFAEVGFKQLFRLIREVAIKYDTPRQVNLGGKWMEVDPQSWQDRENMTVKVGLGTNDKTRLQQSLTTVLAEQKEHIQKGSPMVTLEQIHSTYKELAQVMGLGSVDRYFLDPATIEPPQPEPEKPSSEEMAFQQTLRIEQLKIEQDERESRRKAELDEQEMQLKYAEEREKREMEERLKLTELELEYNRDLAGQGIGDQYE